MSEYVQDCRHDLFADVAESYVRYLLACAGFEVYGDSKWAADVAALDPATGRWFRVEVRSCDSGGKPTKKGTTRLAGLTAVAEVMQKQPGQVVVVFTPLKPDGSRDGDRRVIQPDPIALRAWLLKLEAVPIGGIVATEAKSFL